MQRENGHIEEANVSKIQLSFGRGTVVQQVNAVIQQAIGMQASDIHLEPTEQNFRVRYRLDGVLHRVGELPFSQREAIASRIKILSNLDIAEKRRPQDGNIKFGQHPPIDIRVSTLPTRFGEKVVMRILDKSTLSLSLDALGFEPSLLALFKKYIHLPYGMILVTGPTGSGKTTTLYASLQNRNEDAVNIVTIEDPIEYTISGINQTQVHPEIGFTFAHALRAFLRQDPDIIMVGEIRDEETATMAVRAALTGHLVFSTLHTNDAVMTVARLVDMGIKPFLVASSLILVVAQRLVRRICRDCKRPYEPTLEEIQELGLEENETTLFRGAGCEHCNYTGFSGRTALWEILPLSEKLTEQIMVNADVNSLKKVALEEGMQTLRQHGLRLIREGITTPSEVIRETT